MPAHSALDTLIWARPMARPSFFCTAGRTTFTVCGRRPVAGAGLSSDTPRNGQQSVVAVDVIDLIDALKIPKAAIAGFDWGARSANIVAALWPERCKALGSVSGYLIGSQQAGQIPLPPEAELQWWYQYYFATERGRAGYEKYRREFSKLIWRLASPNWKFDDATFNRSAASFDNPDHVSIVIHNYRWRLAWPKARRNMMIWKNGSPPPR